MDPTLDVFAGAARGRHQVKRCYTLHYAPGCLAIKQCISIGTNLSQGCSSAQCTQFAVAFPTLSFDWCCCEQLVVGASQCHFGVASAPKLLGAYGAKITHT